MRDNKTASLRIAGLLLLPGLLHSVEHTVDKRRRFLSTESFCYFNCFVDGNLGGNIVLKEQLEDGHSQQVPVRGSNPFQPPVGGVSPNSAIDLIEFIEDTANE